jgi:hypothetical protein
MAGVTPSASRENGAVMSSECTMDHLPADLELSALAQACEERAHELQACAWRSEAERNALRENTAQLLASIARQLSESQCIGAAPVQALSSGELRRIIDSQVVHAPLRAASPPAPSKSKLDK